MKTCDFCGDLTEFLIYAAYDIDGPKGGIVDHPHPRVARYPGVMFHSCTDCLGVLVESDKIKPGATGQYVIKAVK